MDNKILAVDARHLKSGIGTYLKCLLPRMIELSDYRWKIIGPSYWERYDSDRVQWVPCEMGIYTLKEHFMIPKLAKGADLLWVPHYNAPENWSGKLVITLHDMIHCMKEYPRPWLKSLLGKQIMKWALDKSEKVITVSEYSKTRIGEFFPGMFPKVEVIYNGAERIPEKSGESFYNFPYILSFGNALAHKNFPRLMEAYLKVCGRIDAHLIIAGYPGSDITRMEEIARKNPQRIHLLPAQDKSAWANLIHHAQLYVCPSLEEGFGLPPLEALGAGIPVAVAKRASLPEVLEEAAFWFDPLDIDNIAEVLVKACEEEVERQEVLVKGCVRLQQFTWDNSAEKHHKLIREILNY